MERDVKISLVIPLYNKEDFIERCLNSVRQQTVQPFEVVVVNDGSTDNGLSIAKEYSYFPISIITQKNAGVSVARNSGIQAAKGNWVLFLDSDDELMPHAVESFQNAAKNFTDAEVVFGWSTERTETSAFSYVPSYSEPKLIEDYFAYLLGGQGKEINSSSVMIEKKAFLDAGTFAPGIKVGEDTDMWFRLACKCKIVCLYDYISIYNLLDGSSDWQAARNDTPFWYSTYQNWRQGNKIQPSLISSVDRYYNFDIIQKALWYTLNGQRKSAVSLFFKRVNFLKSPKIYYIKVLLYILLNFLFPFFFRSKGTEP